MMKFSMTQRLVIFFIFCAYLGEWYQFSGDKVQYPEHLPLSAIQKGLKTGKYLQGKFMASRENYTEANVSVADQEKMVIPGRDL